MVKKCVYCRNDIQDKRAIDVCDKCGVVKEKRGRSFIISLSDSGKLKKFIIDPVHLKKISLVNPSK